MGLAESPHPGGLSMNCRVCAFRLQVDHLGQAERIGGIGQGLLLRAAVLVAHRVLALAVNEAPNSSTSSCTPYS